MGDRPAICTPCDPTSTGTWRTARSFIPCPMEALGLIRAERAPFLSRRARGRAGVVAGRIALVLALIATGVLGPTTLPGRDDQPSRRDHHAAP